jgi:hypothetical protein
MLLMLSAIIKRMKERYIKSLSIGYSGVVAFELFGSLSIVQRLYLYYSIV